MQRDEILRRLEELVPEIQASKDAEGTLLKFASEHNLAPAQLETLAQVYNNGKALTFYAKSANRGGTFKLVETEPLLERYTDHLSQNGLSKKHATVKSASTNAVDGGRFPHFRTILEPTEALEKSASVVEELEALSCGIVQHYRNKKAAVEACEMAEELRTERMDTIRAILDDIKDEVRFDKEAFTRLEEDALDIWDDKAECKAVFDKAADYLKRANCDVSAYRFSEDKASGRAVARDTTGHLPKMASVREGLSFIKASHEFSAEFQKAAVKQVPRPQGKHNLEGDVGAQLDTWATGKKLPPGTEEESSKKDNKGPKEKADYSTGNETQPPSEESLARPKSYNKEEKGDSKETSVMDSLLKGMTDTKWKGPSPSKTLEGGKKLIDTLGGGKNTRQLARDTAVAEDLGTASLQRLMVSDPILAEASPEEVLAHYNTINEIAPAVASDPNKLRLPLREAVQYGSIPMHTLKELLEINKLIQANQSALASNESARYGGQARPAPSFA